MDMITIETEGNFSATLYPTEVKAIVLSRHMLHIFIEGFATPIIHSFPEDDMAERAYNKIKQTIEDELP